MTPSRDQYFPLRQNLSSDELLSLKIEGGPYILSKYNKRTLKLWSPTILFATLSLLLALSNVLTVYQLSHARKQNEQLKSSYTGLDQTRDYMRPAFTSSQYTSPNHTEANAAWKAIQPGHGVVAVEHDWAAQRQLPTTMDLPSNPNMSVYVIEGYHALHCIKTLRATYLELLAGKIPTVPEEHTTHCWDALRQHVVCTADDTLLYTWGDRSAGVDQSRGCKNWDALRDWATDHTACYQADPEDGVSYWGDCDKGTDGLSLG